MRIQTKINVNEVSHMIVTLDERYITPFFDERFKYVPKKQNKTESDFFVNGHIYSLKGAECDDFTMPTKEFELVGKIKNLNGVDVDAVIMKQISGESSTMFSLTKYDCHNLGIEFQKGLVVYPKNLNWEKVSVDAINEPIEDKEIEFDSSRLATYPPSYDDRTIHRMIIKLSNILPCGQGKIMLPTNQVVSENTLRHLLIQTKIQIGSACDETTASFPTAYAIPYEIITKQISRVASTSNGIVDENGCVFLELKYTRPHLLHRNSTIGIRPEIFGDYSFNDCFSVNILVDSRTEPNPYRMRPIHREPTMEMSKFNDVMERMERQRLQERLNHLARTRNPYINMYSSDKFVSDYTNMINCIMRKID